MAKRCPEVDNWCTSELQTIKTSFLWTIKHFNQLPEKTGEMLKSSTFSADKDINTKWYLYIYPNGENEENKDFIGVFLHLKESDRNEVSANVKMALIDGNQNICEEEEEKNCFELNTGFGWSEFVSRSLIEDSSRQLLPKDRLTIFCEVTTTGKRKMTSGQKFGIKRKLKTLSDDMTALYQNLNDSDVEIVVNGHKFTAHKLILRTRSPVFAAMFEHPMKESQQNQVIIEDIDKEVFGKVLRFIYTDKVVNEDIESTKELLSAADKYNLDELKYICEEYIGSQLSFESVSDVLILADNHSSQELKTKAIDFIKTNSKKVMKTKGWKNVIDRPDLLDLC